MRPPQLPKLEPLEGLPSDSLLEPEFREPFGMYRFEPSKHNASRLLTALQPTIDKGIRANVGGNVSPLTRSHARKLALGAIRTYDPRQAKLSTHVINNLQGLRRITRRQQEVINVPERVVLDQRYLHQMAEEYEDRYGREPSTQQLADFSGLSLKRIERVRQYQPALATGQLEAQLDAGGEVSGYSPAVASGQAHRAWIEAVYQDLNPTDQLIMEMTLGLHGKRARSNQEIARKLRLTPGAISQRKARIQQALNQEAELSPFT